MKHELAAQVRASKDELLNQYLGAAPVGNALISQENVTTTWLADLIENTHDLSNDELLATQDIGRFFSYHSSDDGVLSLSAEKAFYYAYEAVASGGLYGSIADDIKCKLLHEAAHLWGYNEEQATVFSKGYYQALTYVHVPTSEETESQKALLAECTKIKQDVDAETTRAWDSWKANPFFAPYFLDAEALVKHNRDSLENLRQKTLSSIPSDQLAELKQLKDDYHKRYARVTDGFKNDSRNDDKYRLLENLTKEYKPKIVGIMDPALHRAVRNMRTWKYDKSWDDGSGNVVGFFNYIRRELSGTFYSLDVPGESYMPPAKKRFLEGETGSPFISTPKGSLVGNTGVFFGYVVEHGSLEFVLVDLTEPTFDKEQLKLYGEYLRQVFTNSRPFATKEIAEAATDFSEWLDGDSDTVGHFTHWEEFYRAKTEKKERFMQGGAYAGLIEVNLFTGDAGDIFEESVNSHLSPYLVLHDFTILVRSQVSSAQSRLTDSCKAVLGLK